MRLRVHASIAAFAAFGLMAPFFPACSNAADEETDDSALMGGDASGTEDDAVVLLVRDNKPLCTATLIAPNLLITAHHCVGIRQGNKVVTTYEPGEISVRIGGTPGDKAAAVATKIYAPKTEAPTPDPQTTSTTSGTSGTTTPQTLPDGGLAAAAQSRGLESTDIAMILVQGLDPSFDRIRPLKLRDRSVSETDTVGVVGWNANGQTLQINALKRMKRTGVDVLADSTQQTQVQSPSVEAIASTNKPYEFITESVACQGDDGAPAFDTQGNLAGFVVGIVGPCDSGSLSIFTDVPAQKAFITSVLSDVQRLQCTTDSKCGAGNVCDTRSFSCAPGCRSGGTPCAGGGRCTSPSESTPGLIGTCSASGGLLPDGGRRPDPIQPPPFDGGTELPLDDGGVGPGPGPSAPSCTDKSCGGTTAAPKVCSTSSGQCVPGCRVGASPSMCPSGQECKRGTDQDPDVGQCVATTVTAPPPPTLSPAPRPNETIGDPNATTAVPESADAGKKKKNKAKDGGGCTISHAQASGSALGWLSLAAAIAFARRRRNNAR